MNEFKMRVIKYVMEHIKTQGKNTLCPQLFIKTDVDRHKILELPEIFFEDYNDRAVASFAIKHINNNTNTEYCCFVAEAKMGKMELAEDMKTVKKKQLFDGVTFVFQAKTDSESEVMAFTINDDLQLMPLQGANHKETEFESPFKHLF